MIQDDEVDGCFVQYHPIVNGEVDYTKGLVSTEGAITLKDGFLEIISKHTRYCFELLDEPVEKYACSQNDFKIW